jgi:hypothetical protein
MYTTGAAWESYDAHKLVNKSQQSGIRRILDPNHKLLSITFILA